MADGKPISQPERLWVATGRPTSRKVGRRQRDPGHRTSCPDPTQTDCRTRVISASRDRAPLCRIQRKSGGAGFESVPRVPSTTPATSNLLPLENQSISSGSLYFTSRDADDRDGPAPHAPSGPSRVAESPPFLRLYSNR